MNEALQNNLKSLRERHGWSQAELASAAGMSRSEVSAIEIGRLVPSTSAALRLAQVFGCTVEDLFSLRTMDDAAWAWEAGGERYWQAEVGRQERRFPVEVLPTGELTTDERATVRRLPRETLVMAVCDPAVALLARRLEQAGVRCLAFVRSSRAALQLLAEGKVHVAGVHLGATPDENRSVAAGLLPKGHSLLSMATWEEGLAIGAGLPAVSLRSRELRKLRWVGREPGSGARRCSDALLESPRKAPEGYDRFARDHRGVAEAIRCGWADVGVCVRLAAEEAGLRFQSVAREAYDLCFRDSDAADPRLQALVRAVQSPEFRGSVGNLPGYDSRHCGELSPIL